MALDKQFVLRLQTSTHYELAERASEEGLSMNMLLNRLVSLYLEGKIDINDNQLTDESIQKWEKLEAEIEQIKSRLELLEASNNQKYSQDKPSVQILFKEDSSATKEYLSQIDNSSSEPMPDNSDLSTMSSHNHNFSNTDSELKESQERGEIEKNTASNIQPANESELEKDSIVDSGSEVNQSSSLVKQAPVENTEKSTISTDINRNIDINKEELKDVGLEDDLLKVDGEKQVPQVVIDLFTQAVANGGSGKVRRPKILEAVGLNQKALANPPQWWSKIEFNDQGWGELSQD